MEQEVFKERKKNLISLIEDHLRKVTVSREDKLSLMKVLEILNGYSFENRLEKKGLLSHAIVDSLEINYSLGEKLIQFDNSIT